jgi:hypothetical protein
MADVPPPICGRGQAEEVQFFALHTFSFSSQFPRLVDVRCSQSSGLSLAFADSLAVLTPSARRGYRVAQD